MQYDGVLQGSCVALRSVRIADCTDRYLQWMTDKEVNQYMETRWSVQTLETIKGFVRRILESDDSYLFAILYDGHHVGNAKIGPINRRYSNADISYFIGEKSCWGRGVAFEAVSLLTRFGFECLQLHRLQAGAFCQNIGSQRVLERNGFVREGVAREKYFLSSEADWTDCYEYALLRNEWEAMNETR